MRPPRASMAFLVGLIVGLAGETLLFLERQCAKIEGALVEDFRVVCFLKEEPGAGREKVLEEQLRALPGVADARYVTRREALAALRRDEPELVESTLLLSDNPLLPAFEVKFDPLGLARVSEWTAQARRLADWADIRYKTAEVEAALQAQFYRHAIGVALDASVCGAALLIVVGLWPAWPIAGRGAVRAVYASGGALAGAAATALIMLPLHVLTPWWSWPAFSGQALLIAGAGMAGWVLCRD